MAVREEARKIEEDLATISVDTKPNDSKTSGRGRATSTAQDVRQFESRVCS
jgi:hypothetical protein